MGHSGWKSTRTGLNVAAIRYYEEVDLIPQAMRRPSGHRVYGAQAHELLTLIRRCRDFGFSVDDTKTLVSLAASDDRGCVEARDLAQGHLDAVRARLADLLALERTLNTFVAACTEHVWEAPRPDVPSCRTWAVARLHRQYGQPLHAPSLLRVTWWWACRLTPGRHVNRRQKRRPGPPQ